MSQLRKIHMQRLEALKQEASSWRAHWQDLSEQIQPWRGRFVSSDRNRGHKKNLKIINSTPRRAARILAAGMMTGITSPARPWFRLTTQDPALAESAAVKAWLYVAERRIREAFAKSNLYNALHSVYVDLGTFATAVLHIDEDADDGIRGYVFPVGQYYLANSSRLQVDTVYRECGMTVGQLVKRFGLQACSPSVQEAWKREQRQKWVDVIHTVGPREEKGSSYASSMPWASCWMEKSPSRPDWGLLLEAGYEEFPVICPRWDVSGEDVYGTASPGMDALPTCKGLQQLEKRRLEMVDITARPPMKGPPNIRAASIVPGTFTPVPLQAGGQTYEPSVLINHGSIAVVKDSISDHEQGINSTFFADLWLSLLNEERDITAREVAERHEEKMQQLGPVVERLQDELLEPTIDRVFGILLRRGDIPRAPPELEGLDLKVEYLSVMAQAQKLLSTSSIERTGQFAVGLAGGGRADALDKLNVDKMVEAVAEAVGLPPDLLLSGSQVSLLREERAKQQQAAQQGQAMLAAAQGAKDLSAAKLSDESALSRIVGELPAAMAGGGQ